MGLIFESNQCDRCKKSNNEVGKIILYKEYNKQYLCENCYKELKKDQSLQCPKCKKIVGKSGLTTFKNKLICYKCAEESKLNNEKRSKQKDYIKNHWYYWITIGLLVIGLIFK